MIILIILRIQPWLCPTKLHCFGVSISFNLIYNIYMWFVENFCVYPQLPAKIFDSTEDYKTGCQFYIFLYFVIFFSSLLQADCVASNQPLIFTCFHRKYLSFPCFTDIPQFFFNRTIFFTCLPTKIPFTNSLYNCCNSVYLICWTITYSLIHKTCI